MNYVASSLSMSKRTLYEIFGSKLDMIRTCLLYFHKKHIMQTQEVLSKAENIMEGMLHMHLIHRDIIANLNQDFFKDLDFIFPEIKHDMKQREHDSYQNFANLYAKGVKEGVFREESNYAVLFRMLSIQMESIKRMEKIFPADIKLIDIYDNIIIAFLRSIASQKGMIILDNITEKYKIFKK